jgi:hypothetical protein
MQVDVSLREGAKKLIDKRLRLFSVNYVNILGRSHFFLLCG